jgi:hypothetical protein
MQGRDAVSHLHIVRLRAEAQQLGIRPAMPSVLDRRLQRAFVAEIPRTKVPVKSDSC